MTCVHMHAKPLHSLQEVLVLLADSHLLKKPLGSAAHQLNNTASALLAVSLTRG